jgi:hypothetical protein
LLAIAVPSRGARSWARRFAGGRGRPRPHTVAKGVTVNGFAGWIHDKFLHKTFWQFT